MSKPFMFHFTAKLYTIFYSRNFFRNFFLKKAKKISPRKQKLSLLCYKTYFYTKILDYFKKKHYFCTQFSV